MTEFGRGNFVWTLNAQNPADRQPNAAEVRQFMLWISLQSAEYKNFETARDVPPWLPVP